MRIDRAAQQLSDLKEAIEADDTSAALKIVGSLLEQVLWEGYGIKAEPDAELEHEAAVARIREGKR